MWQGNWRDEVWSRLNGPWDIMVIGGGITGAGILREASRLRLRTLLVEQRDFGWGTSSRSSKLVHGGLRYLRDGQLALTRAAVRERERLLKEGPGIIEPLDFLLATYKGDRPGRHALGAALALYDLLGAKWDHPYYGVDDFRMLVPDIAQAGLQGGFRYRDAATDDARLVIRVIREGVAGGGVAINYVAAEDFLFDGGQVVGARLRDLVENRTGEARARVVINATGAWADRLRNRIGVAPRIRPLRGSHLVFPGWRLPVKRALGMFHPVDHRALFIIPWQGVTVVGTTDLDSDTPLDEEYGISAGEVAYLMAAVHAQFPSLGLTLDDVISSYAGVRPVIGSGKANPSEESRDHAIWEESGLLTITGGKLTTFRLIARDALKAARHRLPEMPVVDDRGPALNPVCAGLLGAAQLGDAQWCRLRGRYGDEASEVVAIARGGELEPVPGTQTLWVEVRWAARAEGVTHLDDLLLRRVRLGLLLPEGGRRLLPRIRAICQPELNWTDARWEVEEAAYLDLWRRCYSLPDRATIPDWRAVSAEVEARRQVRQSASAAGLGWVPYVGAALGGASVLACLLSRRKRRR